MPLDINDQMIAELVKRQIQQEDFNRSMESPKPYATASEPLVTPRQALLAGGLADAASTYTFLKRKTGTEGNVLLAPLKNRPLPTAAAAAGSTGLMLLAHKLLSKKSPKIADALAGGLGGFQAKLAASNLHVGDDPTNLEATPRPSAAALEPLWKTRQPGIRPVR